MTEQYHLRNIKTGEIIVRDWTESEYYDHMDDDMVIQFGRSRYERFFPQQKEMGKKIPWARPLVSVAAGVHPSQAKEFTEAAHSAGFTGISFDKEGDMHATTRGQRAGYLKHSGMCDREAGYSD